MFYQLISHIYTYQIQSKIYRVSLKSFPDYKDLLQENNVEYKHIFLSLLKLESKKKLLELSYNKKNIFVFHIVFL